MRIIADFHIHSRFARGTSKEINLENLNKWALVKGVNVLGTGDFTHPGWFEELKNGLEPAEEGLFKLKNNSSSLQKSVRFILSSEISCIYSKGGKVRKVHIVVLAPGFKEVEKINQELSKIGNLKSDGRPILGLDAKELVKIVLEVCPKCFIIPAHIWTPWFGILGSKSGFDSIEECFEDYAKYIYAGETGLSSDPPMNWRVSSLDKIALVSNSDAHSLEKIGREANVFETNLSYSEIIEAIKEKNPEKFLYTIEFFPEEGKYHYDGHRACDISFSPKETKKYNGICPVCGKPLTIGVLNRVEELADREEGFMPKNKIAYKSLIPLKEIISKALLVGEQSKIVQKEYEKLIDNFGDEFNILLFVSENEIKKIAMEGVAEAIAMVRRGKVEMIPGYDGVFGKIVLNFDKINKKVFQKNRQKTLF